MNLINKLIIFFCLFFFIFQNSNSIENKILIKIDNEIITSLDLLNEMNYLLAVNTNLKTLEKDKIIEIAKNSLIKQKIKKKEILKYTNNLIVEEQYLNSFIRSIYKNIQLDNLSDFELHLKNYSVKIEYLKEKISTDLIWNDLIVSKFKDKVQVNENQIKSDLIKNMSTKSNEYLLSEIIFNKPLTSSLESKIDMIENDIKNKGFENAAIIHSISNSSSKNGGEIGWIDENSLNYQIKNSITNLKVGEHTKPSIIPGGFIILKIKDIREIDNKDFNIDQKVEEIINIKRNEQLNNYSNIYYNKIQKEFTINEQ